MLSWVLQVLLEEMFHKAVSQSKDRTVLFPMPLFFRDSGREEQEQTGKTRTEARDLKAFVSAGTPFQCTSLEHGTVVWLEFLSFLCAGMTFHAHGSDSFKNPVLCIQNHSITCIATEQRKGPSACEALFTPLVEVCSKAEIGALFCV